MVFPGAGRYRLDLEPTVGQSATGFLFKTYRIPVPAEQIAWEVSAIPAASTNPDMAVRLGKVPNAFNNDAFSEVPGTTTSDSITQIDFNSSTLNNDPTRAGWRFFAVSDIGQQLGQLGWLLELSNHVPGTEIAIRRNYVPGRWNYRKNGSTYVYSLAHNDQTSTLGFLQDPDHEADVWYVGIYSPDAALGAFTLDSGSHTPTEISVDGFSSASVSLPPKSWRFYHVDVPAQTNGQDVIGWELRTTEWSGSRPYMSVRRDLLPEGLGTWAYPRSSTGWASGNQWTTSGGDWPGYYYDATATQPYPKYLLSMGMGSPLSVGTYYIGFYNNSSTVIGTFSFASSAIGNGMTYDPQPLAFEGNATITNLPAHDVEYFKVEVPAGQSSWKLQLENTSGETTLYIREGHVPTWSMYQHPTYSPGASFSYMPRLQKADNEHYLLLPENGATTIPGGTSNDAATATNLATAGSTYYDDYSAVPGQLYHYWVSVGGVTNTAWFSSVDSGWRPGIGSITPSQRTHTAEGGIGTIDIVAPTGTYWNATESLNWVSIQSGSPGTNNGTVAYNVSEYAGTVSRTGSVTVAGQTFTVVQEPLGLPGNVQATDGDHEDRTVVTWDTVVSATRYYMYRNTTNSTASATYQGCDHKHLQRCRWDPRPSLLLLLGSSLQRWRNRRLQPARHRLPQQRDRFPGVADSPTSGSTISTECSPDSLSSGLPSLDGCTPSTGSTA